MGVEVLFILFALTVGSFAATCDDATSVQLGQIVWNSVADDGSPHKYFSFTDPSKEEFDIVVNPLTASSFTVYAYSSATSTNVCADEQHQLLTSTGSIKGGLALNVTRCLLDQNNATWSILVQGSGNYTFQIAPSTFRQLENGVTNPDVRKENSYYIDIPSGTANLTITASAGNYPYIIYGYYYRIGSACFSAPGTELPCLSGGIQCQDSYYFNQQVTGPTTVSIWATCDSCDTIIGGVDPVNGFIPPLSMTASFENCDSAKKCHGQGMCWNDVCTCLPGFSGSDCSAVVTPMLECPLDCSLLYGTCDGVSGTCQCNNGYAGAGCDCPVSGYVTSSPTNTFYPRYNGGQISEYLTANLTEYPYGAVATVTLTAPPNTRLPAFAGTSATFCSNSVIFNEYEQGGGLSTQDTFATQQYTYAYCYRRQRSIFPIIALASTSDQYQPTINISLTALPPPMSLQPGKTYYRIAPPLDIFEGAQFLLDITGTGPFTITLNAAMNLPSMYNRIPYLYLADSLCANDVNHFAASGDATNFAVMSITKTVQNAGTYAVSVYPSPIIFSGYYLYFQLNYTVSNCQTSCGHGTCYNGACVCFDGYSGTNCDKLSCSYNCFGAGTCQDNDVCLCDATHSSRFCNVTVIGELTSAQNASGDLGTSGNTVDYYKLDTSSFPYGFELYWNAPQATVTADFEQAPDGSYYYLLDSDIGFPRITQLGCPLPSWSHNWVVGVFGKSSYTIQTKKVTATKLQNLQTLNATLHTTPRSLDYRYVAYAFYEFDLPVSGTQNNVYVSISGPYVYPFRRTALYISSNPCASGYNSISQGEWQTNYESGHQVLFVNATNVQGPTVYITFTTDHGDIDYNITLSYNFIAACLDCSGRGTCAPNGDCQCSGNWTGTHCEIDKNGPTSAAAYAATAAASTSAAATTAAAANGQATTAPSGTVQSTNAPSTNGESTTGPVSNQSTSAPSTTINAQNESGAESISLNLFIVGLVAFAGLFIM